MIDDMIKVNDSIMIQAITRWQTQEWFSDRALNLSKHDLEAIYSDLEEDGANLCVHLGTEPVPATVIDIVNFPGYFKLCVSFIMNEKTIVHWVWGCHIVNVINHNKKRQLNVIDI